MALVKGSNGLVFDFPESIAADLIRCGHAVEFVKPAPKPAKKSESAPADDK